jgi:hypothetical protein
MMVADLLKLAPGHRLIHLPTGSTATVAASATPSRAHGWRVQVRRPTGTCWITPANASDWRLDTK